VDFDLVAQAVLAALRADTGRPGDFVHVAADTERPFFTMFDLTSSWTQGSMGKPHETGQLFYQITSVGDTYSQCQWMASKVWKAMTDQDHGHYRVAIAVEGGENIIIGRTGQHGPSSNPDERSFNQVDTFSCMVQHLG
jgi:hypothetical protein